MANADPITATAEEWRDIPEWEGLYEVSNQGRVRSRDTLKIDSLGRPRKGRGKVLSADIKPNGYVYVNLKDKPRKQRRYVHQLVLEAFVGPRPEGMEACHDNGDRADNRLENLRWDTVSENRLDIKRMGRHNEGNKTHCDNGHEFTPENTLLYGPRGDWRRCIACQKARGRMTTL